MNANKRPPKGQTPSPTAETTPPTPWGELDESGSTLDVFYFPTALMNLVGAVLRRSVTMPYLEAAGLTFAEWKILSVLAHGKTLPFIDIEVLSATDKSLVSKTLRLLEGRGLVTIKDRGNSGRKQLTSTITKPGQKLNDQVISLARKEQAKLLLMLSGEEREALFRALSTWHQAFTGKPLPAPDNI